jgi:hypothetical protein
LDENPVKNQVHFTFPELDFITVRGRPLNEDDSFNSNPLLGFIVYRIPSPHELLGCNPEDLGNYNELYSYVSIKYVNEFEEKVHLKCKNNWNCRIRHWQHYSPLVMYINPPVIYYEAYTQVVYDPRGVTDALTKNLKSDELPFINVEIGGSKLDFEFQVDYMTDIDKWIMNYNIGQVGSMPIGHEGNDIKMLWEIGYAVQSPEATHCNYDMSRCYSAMNVPVIFNISSHIGFTSGR